MKLVKLSILVVVGLLLFAVVCGFLMPRAWKAEASGSIRAPVPAVYAWLEDVRKWPRWYPYNQEKDPTIQFTFSGPQHGAGAAMSWTSERLGAATLTLSSASPSTGVRYDLVFQGFDRPSHGQIELAPEPSGTRVTWRDGGELGTSPIPRLFRGMIERMLVLDFSTGLERLAALAESETKPRKE